MDFTQILSLVANSPVVLVLLWLIYSTQKELAEVRRARDEDNHIWIERFAVLADRVSLAVERLDLPGDK